MKIFGVVGWKNSGKTGLVERLVAEFVRRGKTVSTIKHAHHNFDIDQPGRDSHRHREAGASQVLLSSTNRWALMNENRGQDEADLAELLAQLEPVDVVIVEGFKAYPIPKIEARRLASSREHLANSDKMVVAIAADHEAEGPSPLPRFSLDDTKSIADFIQDYSVENEKAKSDGTGDCFSLPPGVNWIPVDDALAMLRNQVRAEVKTKSHKVPLALGKVLGQDAIAQRPSPPLPNTAVDGYGFAHQGAKSPATLPLVEGRVAPGEPLGRKVEKGHAVRVLTGAPLPEGVDTVVLQEQVSLNSDNSISMASVPKTGANTRNAGEDVKHGDPLLKTGHRLSPQDLAHLTAAGIGSVDCFETLRVAVLSTGNELIDASEAVRDTDILDANRPMLLALAQKWGFDVLDLAIAKDSPDAIALALDRGAAQADVILTSGGASAGDEDHIASLLRDAGSLNMWRIALKPGRPLVLGHWQSTPVFGLPGNPVAAFVCALIFARPALLQLAGSQWRTPVGFQVQAAFTKSKKAGRREFLRARLNGQGCAEVFASEGSGRVSSLSWADGLVELADPAQQINLGDPVRFIPYASFGL